jgi:hypothetical protein
MKYLKNDIRTALTDSHLEDQLRLKTTSLVPRFASLATNKQAHKSN